MQLYQISGLGKDSAGNALRMPPAADRSHCLLSRTLGNGMKSESSCLSLAAAHYTAFIEVADKPGTDAEHAMQYVHLHLASVPTARLLLTMLVILGLAAACQHDQQC